MPQYMLTDPDLSTSPTFESLLLLATINHAGQVDKDGQPYILHVLRVSLKQTHIVCRLAALLHDLIEDTEITLQELRSLGIHETIVGTVDSLTRRDNETYSDYIERLADNAWAVPVKIADLIDNMDTTRLPNGVATGKDIDLMRRYRKALNRLTTGEPMSKLVQIKSR